MTKIKKLEGDIEHKFDDLVEKMTNPEDRKFMGEVKRFLQVRDEVVYNPEVPVEEREARRADFVAANKERIDEFKTKLADHLDGMKQVRRSLPHTRTLCTLVSRRMDVKTCSQSLEVISIQQMKQRLKVTSKKLIGGLFGANHANVVHTEAAHTCCADVPDNYGTLDAYELTYDKIFVLDPVAGSQKILDISTYALNIKSMLTGSKGTGRSLSERTQLEFKPSSNHSGPNDNPPLVKYTVLTQTGKGKDSAEHLPVVADIFIVIYKVLKTPHQFQNIQSSFFSAALM